MSTNVLLRSTLVKTHFPLSATHMSSKICFEHTEVQVCPPILNVPMKDGVKACRDIASFWLHPTASLISSQKNKAHFQMVLPSKTFTVLHSFVIVWMKSDRSSCVKNKNTAWERSSVYFHTPGQPLHEVHGHECQFVCFGKNMVRCRSLIPSLERELQTLVDDLTLLHLVLSILTA